MVGSAQAVAGDAESRISATASAGPATPATVPGWTVVPLRLYLSSAFLEALTDKAGPRRWSAWLHFMPGFVARLAPHAAGWYQPVLAHVVLPHAILFAALVSIGEVAVGFGLLFGALTRLAAAGGILLTANYFLLNGLTVADVSNDFAILVGLIVVFLSRAGRTLGVDAWLARRWPHVPLW
jgi:thiosulfate dehydrogenase [quinone] large subunit